MGLEKSRPGWRQWTEGDEAAKVKSDGPQGRAEELRLRPEGQSAGAASALLTAKTDPLPLSPSAALPLRLSAADLSLQEGIITHVCEAVEAQGGEEASLGSPRGAGSQG